MPGNLCAAPPADSCRHGPHRRRHHLALVLANAQGIDRRVFFRKLMIYGALVTLIAPVAVWLPFVVI